MARQVGISNTVPGLTRDLALAPEAPGQAWGGEWPA